MVMQKGLQPSQRIVGHSGPLLADRLSVLHWRHSAELNNFFSRKHLFLGTGILFGDMWHEIVWKQPAFVFEYSRSTGAVRSALHGVDDTRMR